MTTNQNHTLRFHYERSGTGWLPVDRAGKLSFFVEHTENAARNICDGLNACDLTGTLPALLPAWVGK